MLGSSSTGINSRISHPIGIDSAPIQPYSSVHLSMMYVSGCCIIPIRMVMIHCHLVNGEVRTKSPPNCTSTAWIPAVITVTNGSARFFPIPLNILSSLSRIRDEYSLNICKKMNALNTIVVSV